MFVIKLNVPSWARRWFNSWFMTSGGRFIGTPFEVARMFAFASM